MKKVYTILTAVLLTATLWAQTPEKMSYQAVVRDASDNLVANQAIGMQISILQGTADGTAVYTETHSPTSNANGLVTIEIGAGTSGDDFTAIDWATGPYFIKTETDLAGGTNYTITGISQLLSVPYALHAKTAESITGGITETDPIFGASVASGITGTDTTNWNNKLENYSETDPEFTTWDKSTGILITESQISDLSHTIDTDTQLDSTDIAGLGFVAGAHTIDTNTQLDSTDIANLGYVAGAELDGDATNEIQDISISGNQLTITSGSTVTLPAGGSSSLPVYTSTEIAALTPAQGDAVFNSTENLYQVYDGSAWQSFNANCWPQPTSSNAGSNQYFDDATVTATLAANSPEAGHGTGAWTVVSGTGGSFADAGSPTTTFSGTLHTIYTLRWTISTNCNSSTDDVVIAFKQDGAGSTLTDADGNTYNTVYIGNQLWMAENLKVTQEAGGTAIPTVTDDNSNGSTNDEWAALGDNDTDKAYCWYNNDSTANAGTYGALYTYAAAKDACPTGWHLPSDAEWTELTDYVAANGHSGTEGTALKATSGWNESGNGTDDYSFSALPGGGRYANDGAFNSVGYGGYWWGSPVSNSSNAYGRALYYNSSEVNRFNDIKSNGFSVRCVRDN